MQNEQELTLKLSTGKEIDVLIEWQSFADNNYGADADGNRGISTNIVEDYSFDFDKTELTLQEINEIEQKCENWLDNNY